MSMTDPISDLLTRIRNAQMAKHRVVEVPSSKMKTQIVKIFQEEGYIESFTVEPTEPRNVIRILLKYGPSGERAITGLERVSRPGRRVYCGKNDIPKVLGGLGVSILSTPKGVLTGTSCQKLGVGGEVLCNVW